MPLADFVVIGLRGLAFATALQAAGGPIFMQLFGRHLDNSFRSIRTITVWSAGVALLFVSLHALVEPARLIGDLRGMFDTSLHKVLLASDAGTTLGVRVTGLLLILIGLAGVRCGSSALALVGATLTVASFAFMGHTVTDDQRWLVAPLLIIHLLVVAFWFGGLWPLLCVIRHESVAVAGAVVAGFSRYAGRCVPLILLAGIALAVVLLDSWSALRTPYGLSLLAKVSVFTVLIGLASLNRWRYGPALVHGKSTAARGFRFTTLAEWFLILGVLMLTAAMTSLFAVH